MELERPGLDENKYELIDIKWAWTIPCRLSIGQLQEGEEESVTTQPNGPSPYWFDDGVN